MNLALCTPLRQKAIDILQAADLTDEARQRRWAELEQRYSPKSVRRKVDELSSRGYLLVTTRNPLSWLTDKGRHALESSLMRE